jgi:hypothetical protein
VEGCAAHAPAVSGIDILVDMGLIDIDQVMAIALRAVPQRAEVLNELPPPRGIGTPQQLAGLLPREAEPVQGSADALAAQQAIEAVLHKRHQTLERPAWRWIRARYRRLDCSLMGGADRFAESRRDPRAKGGRPPLRRYSSAAGPWLL